METKEDVRALYARMEDLCLRAEGGEVGQSDFLSPRELHYGTAYLTRKGVPFFAFGGYAEAERKKLYLLPDYMTGATLVADMDHEEGIDLLESYGYSAEIAAVRIDGSGYRSLTHRDFLGSLLGLGLERSVLGDVVTLEEGNRAVFFCEERIAPFLLSECTKVANDKVKLRRLAITEVVLPERRFISLRDTVASPRLDSVVSALCKLSREKARDAVLDGMVEINFESEDRPDRTVTVPSLISVRGCGRYRILALSEVTRKGRLRLEAEQYR